MPRFEDLDWRGLEHVSGGQCAGLMSLDAAQWRKELKEHDALFEKLRSRLPRKLQLEREMLGLSCVWYRSTVRGHRVVVSIDWSSSVTPPPSIEKNAEAREHGIRPDSGTSECIA